MWVSVKGAPWYNYPTIKELPTSLAPLVDMSTEKLYRVVASSPRGSIMSEECLGLLRALGFKDGEAAIYFSLLERPEGEAIDKILLSSSMSPQEAEEAIKKLAAMGMVKVVSNRLEAADPKGFLGRILEDRRRQFEKALQEESQIVLALQKHLEPIYWEKRLGIRPEEIIQPLDSLQEMEVLTADLIGRAKEEILIFAQTFGWYEKIREPFLGALKRGVSAKVLMMEEDEYSAKRARELERHGVKIRLFGEEWYPARGTLVDGSELVFLIWATQKKGIARPVHYMPHHTKNLGLVRIFSDAFHRRWEGGRRIGGSG